eukprot:TRINITY_DN0_c6552_g1_i1.p1 TRINITY_DN0_c6552_g1~~TRINITY_DN0_c6552_g1_i1.p1  ORF type:complete len:154 (+),score=54.91 TRINITY_DN0_c6552_g1_i1:2-463(+)
MCIRDRYPDIQGVSTGAIASTYQKNRVENICERLGLESLAYLWGREQIELLTDMIDSGLDAIIIKTAVIGLDPTKHLGKSIKELYPHFLDINKKYGMNVCGEGGEFESLVLDCPLYKKNRIRINKATIQEHSKDIFSPVGYMRIEEAVLEPKL